MASAKTSPTEPLDLPPDFFGHNRPHHKFASVAWAVLGILVTLIPALIAGLLLVPELGLGVVLIPALLISPAIGWITAKCLIRSKRLRTPSAVEVLARDHRAPVVYFRPFTEDAEAGRATVVGSWITEEEQLTKVMNEIGPVVAIGAPEEKMPSLGAARLYVEDAKWREAALGLIRRARLVIMRVGGSPGFWWELEAAVRGKSPEQLILLVPKNQMAYENFQRSSRKLIPAALPALADWGKRRLFRGGLKALIFFDRNWAPSIVDLQAIRVPLMRRNMWRPLGPALKMAVRPIYEKLGTAWTAPKVDFRMVILIVCTVLLALDLLFYLSLLDW